MVQCGLAIALGVMVPWSPDRVKLHRGGCSVSPCLWFESLVVRLMDDGNERDKEDVAWQQ